MSKNETYDMFVDKFVPKLTTDDCYTPEPVYNVVRDYVCRRFGVNPETIVRPFYPGGDYEEFDYKPDSFVLDNPPFSILSQILKFYTERHIRFFLFAPGKEILHYLQWGCSCLLGGSITYHNGAQICTSYVTSEGDFDLECDPDFIQAVEDAVPTKPKKKLTKYRYPDNVVSTAWVLMMAARRIPFTFRKGECRFVKNLDCLRAIGKSAYGGACLISKSAEPAKRASDEAKRASDEDAVVITLSEREQEIIDSMSGIEHDKR